MSWIITKEFAMGEQEVPFEHDLPLPAEASPDEDYYSVGHGCREGLYQSRSKLTQERRADNVVWAEASLPHRFRLFDDDGYLYFEGRSDDCDSEEAFAPLDWAMGDSGCVRIDYLGEDGEWREL